jgi:L1 cell adhesion molecule like protein
MKHWPFKVVSVDGKPKVQVEHCGAQKLYTPEEISSMVLIKMKETAESFLGEKVTDGSLMYPLTSTTPSGRRQRMRASLQGSMYCES